jgi:hypothetical protein
MALPAGGRTGHLRRLTRTPGRGAQALLAPGVLSPARPLEGFGYISTAGLSAPMYLGGSSSNMCLQPGAQK